MQYADSKNDLHRLDARKQVTCHEFNIFKHQNSIYL